VPKFKSEFVGFKVSNKLKKEIEELATKNEMSIAEFLRFLVQKYITEQENKNK
jgi:hypothetical protein